MELGLSTRAEGDQEVVAVSGELDVFTAPRLEESLRDLVDAGRIRIVVDLQEVTFLDSTGLGALVKALKWIRERGGQLIVVAGEERIVKVFKITGLDSAMSLQSDLAAALDS